MALNFDQVWFACLPLAKWAMFESTVRYKICIKTLLKLQKYRFCGNRKSQAYVSLFSATLSLLSPLSFIYLTNVKEYQLHSAGVDRHRRGGPLPDQRLRAGTLHRHEPASQQSPG